MKMVERLALAIIKADQEAVENEIEPTSQNWAMELAQAAIRALEVPTEGMVEAGQAADGTITAKEVWSAMIAAAREE